MRVMRVLSLGVVLAATAACAAGTAGSGGGGTTRSSGAPDVPPDTSAALIQEGRALFQSAGARCASCHGAQGQGANNGPNLQDSNWLQISGGYSSIAYIIRNGVAQGDIREPAHIQPMPARGAGGRLTDEEINKIAAFVWNLRNQQ
jgi:mono/diheme cytochrome c family protein